MQTVLPLAAGSGVSGALGVQPAARISIALAPPCAATGLMRDAAQRQACAAPGQTIRGKHRASGALCAAGNGANGVHGAQPAATFPGVEVQQRVAVTALSAARLRPCAERGRRTNSTRRASSALLCVAGNWQNGAAGLRLRVATAALAGGPPHALARTCGAGIPQPTTAAVIPSLPISMTRALWNAISPARGSGVSGVCGACLSQAAAVFPRARELLRAVEQTRDAPQLRTSAARGRLMEQSRLPSSAQQPPK